MHLWGTREDQQDVNLCLQWLSVPSALPGPPLGAQLGTSQAGDRPSGS